MERDNSFIYNKNVLNSNFDVEMLVPNEQSQKRTKLTNLLSINALVCGVEIVASCTFTFIPPLLLKSGFSEFLMTTILGVAPLMDMITVPLLAEWSDHSTLKMGRRRPVIIGLSLILFFSLVTIAFSSRIATTLRGTETSSLHMLILATGVILLDYSYQAIFNPCEALLSDMMTTCDKQIQTLGFSIYSAYLSLGCIIGYLIVCIKWTSIISIGLLQEQMCFLITTVLLVPCLLLTLSNKEIPNNPCNRLSKNVIPKVSLLYNEVLSLESYFSYLTKKYRPLLYLSGATITRQIQRVCSWKMLCCCMPLLKIVHKAACFGGCLLRGVVVLPIGCYRRVQTAPAVIQRVFFVELFGWTTLHCHDKFFTDFVGQYVYGGNPSAKEDTNEASIYDEGIMMGSWCLFLQSLAACLYAFFLQQHLVHLVGARAVFVGGIFVLFLSMILSLALPSVTFLKITTALSGIGTAALTTTPNMLATFYFQNKDVYMTDLLEDEKECVVPQERGLGADLAVLDMAYYLSQIILSFFLGPLIEVFKSSILYMVVSTVASGITFYCASRVVFSPEEFQLALKGKF